jgi:hypothetical protein
LINLKLNLIIFFLKSNKKWKFSMYGVYLWQNNSCHRLRKKCIHTSKPRLWVEFSGEFFIVYDIDIHELNLWPFKDLKFMDEISLKNVFIAFFNNKCIIIYILKKETTTISKRRRFIDGNYIIFSIFFCLIMFHESQTWGLMAVEKL